ncbi:ATP synthase subunit b precursor [Roseivivax sp. THAF40]|uniref:F0F1 ATP synthase subunit B n=1 Tax=unclassified Roseivivax TaxID=2639302 RepID=UPI00126851F5|nr:MULTISPECIES: F0F1 ATP synthase subunit B [unclassified Roseivivax]QFS81420.1 ATP synthase subunit b precursor [Roseivivax sp. THAF197b]QFT45149.1 ATP synthase subunit b precursor [Roseivivax sp. THAF40]
MIKRTALAALVTSLGFATPALAAGDVFFSLRNTDFVVLLGFIVFIGVLIYFKVPGLLGKMLDDRAAGIQSELDEARTLREEAQSLLASYERKQREVQEQADRIVAKAKEDGEATKAQALADLDKSIERRIAAAQDQIASAEQAAIKDVRDRAIAVAVAAARDVVAEKMGKSDQSKLIDSAIDEVGKKLH